MIKMYDRSNVLCKINLIIGNSCLKSLLFYFSWDNRVFKKSKVLYDSRYSCLDVPPVKVIKSLFLLEVTNRQSRVTWQSFLPRQKPLCLASMVPFSPPTPSVVSILRYVEVPSMSYGE